jgi:hypothetical protein
VNYADELAKVMSKILRLCEIGILAREIQREAEANGFRQRSALGSVMMSKENFEGLIQQAHDMNEDATKPNQRADESANGNASEHDVTPAGYLINPRDLDSLTGLISQSQRTKLNELLGAW